MYAKTLSFLTKQFKVATPYFAAFCWIMKEDEAQSLD